MMKKLLALTIALMMLLSMASCDILEKLPFLKGGETESSEETTTAKPEPSDQPDNPSDNPSDQPDNPSNPDDPTDTPSDNPTDTPDDPKPTGYTVTKEQWIANMSNPIFVCDIHMNMLDDDASDYQFLSVCAENAALLKQSFPASELEIELYMVQKDGVWYSVYKDGDGYVGVSGDIVEDEDNGMSGLGAHITGYTDEAVYALYDSLTYDEAEKA